MKKILVLLLTLAIASFWSAAYAGKEAKGHGHEKAGKGGGDHHSTMAGAMEPHGDEEHMKDMAEFQRTMSDNFAGLMGIMTGLIYDRKDAVKGGAKILIKHSDHIAALKPPINAHRIKEYKYYAFQLKEHSKHVLQAIGMKNGEVVYGYHLGEVVDACVSCHTNFRPRLPGK